MKRRITMLFVLLMLLCAAACAEEGFIGCMRVIKCEEWVSLRELPDTKSGCLVEVPLGALVENCREESKAFLYAEYSGMSGYILAQYLEAVPVEQTYLGEMRIIDGAAWTPMYADTTNGATVIQWMAPGERIEDARESVEGMVCGVCRGVRGYVKSSAAVLIENAAEQSEK